MVKVLVEAGANSNSHGVDKVTPLYTTAQIGDADAIKMLLGRKPLL